MKYLPPFELLRAVMARTANRRKSRPEIVPEELQEMIRILLSVIEVDEAFYLTRNADVAEGIKAGTIRSAREHFIYHGYFEGRLPYEIKVDEAWYLKNHPDVAETVRKGIYRRAQDHFDGPGYSEGRAPFASAMG